MKPAHDILVVGGKMMANSMTTTDTLVYLLQNPEKTYEAFCIDKRGNDALFLIPDLDMQTTIKNCADLALNDKRILKMKSVDITVQSVDFVFVS